MRIFRLLATVLCFAALLPNLTAQHDPERNATQAIAEGNVKKARQLLEKEADAGDPEALFVRMMAALQAEEVESAVALARRALEAGLPFERLAVGPRELLGDLHETEQYRQWLEEGKLASPLIHGPMLGSVTATGASVWVRTAGPAEVRVRVPEAGQQSKVATTGESTDFTAVLRIEGLEPETTYRYEVLVEGEPVPVENPVLRTFPERGSPAAFTVAFGGGAGYVPQREVMWDAILEHDPLAMLMLGDNVYIDQPEHTLTQYYCYYRRQSRPEWKRLTSSTAMFAIWDDHDFGTNDCAGGPAIDKPEWKRTVWNIFRQNWVNPAYGGGEEQPGCWQDFYIGDVHVIMIDGRYYRDNKGGTMLGPVQKAWLKDTLKNSTGTFKLLTSPVPWTEGVKPGSDDPWDGFPEEREEIFSFIENEKIEGVFLVAADRHRTDIRVTMRDAGYDLTEFMSSKLTNRHTHKVVETPGLVWGYNDKCSAGLMHFDTTAEDPQVTFEIINIDGESLYTHELKLSELRF